MNQPYLVLLISVVMTAGSSLSWAATTSDPSVSPKPARSQVDPVKESEHTKEDVKRHRTIAAAHEAAAKCQESGTAEDVCMAELARACKGIAYGKYCGMKHPD